MGCGKQEWRWAQRKNTKSRRAKTDIGPADYNIIFEAEQWCEYYAFLLRSERRNAHPQAHASQHIITCCPLTVFHLSELLLCWAPWRVVCGHGRVEAAQQRSGCVRHCARPTTSSSIKAVWGTVTLHGKVTQMIAVFNYKLLRCIWRCLISYWLSDIYLTFFYILWQILHSSISHQFSSVVGREYRLCIGTPWCVLLVFVGLWGHSVV